MKHPIQNIHRDEEGVPRFIANKIVRRLLDEGPFDLNDIALWGADRADQAQFAQLIGYSVSGFGGLSYVDPLVVDAADSAAAELSTAIEDRQIPAGSWVSVEIMDEIRDRYNLMHRIWDICSRPGSEYGAVDLILQLRDLLAPLFGEKE